ncbi:transcription initiation at TATA-containing promoter protein [Didymosphaeria variabile]|uniref:Transcription initiation at TATA-containing promoter protein n=1 Tax=Didymosphaeria variabile TaxID=1932322 RepID=A0A9W9CCV5_9PLEO|nr:transcription initiation at TATA-containing promoter protein [Didymosphaeria variabile]KAJ4355988.1 transcription initiation at TATA-containing promoter protein [Didymosphaeria variabile]
MAVDTESNGVHDVSLETQKNPNVNGNGNHHSSPDAAPALEPTTNVSSGIDGVSQFLPDSHPDNNSLFGDSEMPSVTDAVEAPTSDVRDEAAPDTTATTESTQKVPETQLPVMEESLGGPVQSTDSQANQAPDSTAGSTDSAAPPTKPLNDLKIETQQSATQLSLTESPAVLDQEMEDAPTSGKVRPREEDADMEDAPDAKRTKTQDEGNESAEFKVPDLPAHTEQPNGSAPTPPVAAAAASPSQEPSSVQQAVPYKTWPSAPMTEAQKKFLLERIRNTKKIKVSNAFKVPVDYEALNIPTYPSIVTKPMDLGTMENKLKTGAYTYVAEFMADLDQIVTNSELFNSTTHPVTHDAYNMRAYFLKGTDRLPKEGDEAAKSVKPVKKPTVSTAPKARRESRAAPVAKSPPASIPTTTSTPASAWPLNADGLPMIRRDSSSANDRPKREIHRPPSKDLPYSAAKPRKKKYQLELKFCENVLSELLKPKYAKFSWPFMAPVDPVALNIPSYMKIIKKPMDFGTVKKNLDAGVYQNAKDFYNDAQLVFLNCFKFNPETDEVNKMGKQLNEVFNSLWSEKADWLAQNAPDAEPQSAGSGYSDEEDDEDEEDDPAQAQFLAIQKQIAALNETAQQLLQQQQRKGTSPKAPSKKKSKAGQPKSKAGPLKVPPPAKPAKSKPKKAQAPLSYAQKQEISEGISTLGDADMRRAVQIIRNGCPHLANTNDDEMELDMDEINDDTLRDLFQFIKRVRGPKSAAAEDDEFEMPRPAAPSRQNTSRPKKNKPMGKSEQEDSLRRIQEKMQSFNGAVSGSSQSPPANQESSDDDDDDDDSASESEEE